MFCSSILVSFCAVCQNKFCHYFVCVSSRCTHKASGQIRLNKYIQMMYFYLRFKCLHHLIINSHNWLQTKCERNFLFCLQQDSVLLFSPTGAVHLCSAEMTPTPFLSEEAQCLIMPVLLNDINTAY